MTTADDKAAVRGWLFAQKPLDEAEDERMGGRCAIASHPRGRSRE